VKLTPQHAASAANRLLGEDRTFELEGKGPHNDIANVLPFETALEMTYHKTSHER
jgi:hypothetical protein